MGAAGGRTYVSRLDARPSGQQSTNPNIHSQISRQNLDPSKHRGTKHGEKFNYLVMVGTRNHETSTDRGRLEPYCIVLKYRKDPGKW